MLQWQLRSGNLSDDLTVLTGRFGLAVPRQDERGNRGLSLTVRAYEAIRAAIITCELQPGAAVSESLLCARFGFGKAPVRSALARLVQEGLVHAQARRGYRVSPVTLRDINNLFDLRSILEPAAARLAAGRLSREVLEELDQPWREGYLAGGGVDSSYLAANKAFHLAIAEASGNARLAEMIAQLLDETDRLIYLGLPLASERAEIQLGHQPLIDALVTADIVAAERIAEQHVLAAKQTRIDTIMAGSSLLEANIAPAV